MPQPRALTTEDAQKYLRIRAEMLRNDPWSFMSSPGDDRFAAADDVRRYLEAPQRAIIAIDHGPELGSVAGLVGPTRVRQPHRAEVWGVYTSPACRRQGLARRVMLHTIELARTWPGVEVLALCVSARAPAARSMYESLGFVCWGTEPDVLRIADQSADEHHMHLRLQR